MRRLFGMLARVGVLSVAWVGQGWGSCGTGDVWVCGDFYYEDSTGGTTTNVACSASGGRKNFYVDVDEDEYYASVLTGCACGVTPEDPAGTSCTGLDWAWSSVNGAGRESSVVDPAGTVVQTNDCDDGNALVSPAALETCDVTGTDENCDGVTLGPPTFYRDVDGDNYGNESITLTTSCTTPSGYSSSPDDCDDTNAAVNPDAEERCDDLDADEDCDGSADDADVSPAGVVTFYADTDGDGYGDPSSSSERCDAISGLVSNDDDCDDDAGGVYPGATDLVGDNLDSNCDTFETCYVDDDDDGLLHALLRTFVVTDGDCADEYEGEATDLLEAEDCDDSPSSDPGPAEPLCYEDSDGDTYGAYGSAPVATYPAAPCECPSGTVENSADCDDSDSNIPSAPFYPDADGDGTYSATPEANCLGESIEYSTTPPDPEDADCNDGDDTIFPGESPILPGLYAVEIYYNGVDEDCAGFLDECDQDGDGWGVRGQALCADGGDCDDADPGAYPTALEIWYDGVDQDCLGGSDYDQDGDGDNWDGAGDDLDGHAGPDCDDEDPSIQPLAYDAPYDGVDANCDNSSDYDQDGDRHDSVDGGGDDCDDLDANVNPDVTDVRYDGVDADCNGVECDQDGDGFDYVGGSCGGADCDDDDRTINPGATEVPGDGVDQDCGDDSPIDDYDTDGDGWCGEVYSGISLPAECGTAGLDCNDDVATVYPGAIEIWYDGVDQDCDGRSDYDQDKDDSDSEGSGGDDCNDDDNTMYPGAPDVAYDGVDSDCNGIECDQDGDGYDSDQFLCYGDDCDDSEASINLGAEEVCGNGVDEDCYDGPDAGFPYHEDLDGDGFGGESGAEAAYCDDYEAAGHGYVANSGDCDDRNPAVHPSIAEGSSSEELLYTWDRTYVDGTEIQSRTQSAPQEVTEDCEEVGPTLQRDDDCDGSVNTATTYGSLSVWRAGGAGTVTNATDAPIGSAGNSWLFDRDRDGYGDAGGLQEDAGVLLGSATCDGTGDGGLFVPYVDGTDTDCDDGDAGVNLLAPEYCGNNQDDDCSCATAGPCVYTVQEGVTTTAAVSVLDVEAGYSGGWIDDPSRNGYANDDQGDPTCSAVYPDLDRDFYGDANADPECLCRAVSGLAIDPNGDGYLSGADEIDAGASAQWWTDNNTDCYDSATDLVAAAAVYPRGISDPVAELRDGYDTDCDGLVPVFELDCDNDGYLAALPSADWPGPSDGVDGNRVRLTADDLGLAECSGSLTFTCADGDVVADCLNGLLFVDVTGDTIAPLFDGTGTERLTGTTHLGDVDCDDTCPSRHPDELEVCDGIDNDCRGYDSWVAPDEEGSVGLDLDGLPDSMDPTRLPPGYGLAGEADLDGDGVIACPDDDPDEQVELLPASGCVVLEPGDETLPLCQLRPAFANDDGLTEEKPECNGVALGSGADGDGDGLTACGVGVNDEDDEYIYVLAKIKGEQLVPLLPPRHGVGSCDEPLDQESTIQNALKELGEGLGWETSSDLETFLNSDAVCGPYGTGCVVLNVNLAEADALDEAPRDAVDPDCATEFQETPMVWTLDRIRFARGLAVGWQCQRMYGNVACLPRDTNELSDDTGGAAKYNTQPWDAVVAAQEGADDLVIDPRFWLELGRFETQREDRLIAGCWSEALPKEAGDLLADIAESKIGGDCNDDAENVSRAKYEGPNHAIFSVMPDLLTDEHLSAACAVCEDGGDNDCDGFADCADPDCSPCFQGGGRGCDAPCSDDEGCGGAGSLLGLGALGLGALRARRRSRV